MKDDSESSFIPHPSSFVSSRIRHARLFESAPPQDARIAVAAGESVPARVITRMRYRIIDAEGKTFADDVGLRQRDERRDDARLALLDAAARAAENDLLKGVEELRTAIGISGVVDGIHAQPDFL